ncbi:protein BatD [Porphyromonas cangingivalis]|nr:protein BatD [Porphyromonas cangingivalis]
MKRRISGIFLLILISLGWSHSAFAQGKTDFTLSVPDEIYEGEQFKISFTVNADGKKFKMDEPSG